MAKVPTKKVFYFARLVFVDVVGVAQFIRASPRRSQYERRIRLKDPGCLRDERGCVVQVFHDFDRAAKRHCSRSDWQLIDGPRNETDVRDTCALMALPS
jgi:hypothetical protein